MDDESDPSFASSATLDGVLTRLREGAAADDPELRSRLDRAFSKHHLRLRALVARQLRAFPEQQVEETVQDVLLTAWRRLADHDAPTFWSWLHAIAVRTCANVRRKRRDLLSDDGLFDPGSDAASAYALLRGEERERLFVEAASRVLDRKDQDLVYMRYELGLPREEIARLAGLASADEVRVNLQRSQRRLRRALEDVMREHGHGESLFRPDDG